MPLTPVVLFMEEISLTGRDPKMCSQRGLNGAEMSPHGTLTAGSPWSLRGRLSPGSGPCQTSLPPIFPLATAPFWGIQGRLCGSFHFSAFISLPTFKMPNAATCPGGSNFISYPDCHRRNSLQTPLTDRLLLRQHPQACRASKTKRLTSASPRPRLPLVLKSQAATSTS